MSGARAHQAAAGAATSISSSTATPSTAAMTSAAPMYSWMPARCSARTGAARTKVKTIAIVTGSSSGRACSSRKTMAIEEQAAADPGRRAAARGGIDRSGSGPWRGR